MPKPIPWTPDEIAVMLELNAKNLAYREIAVELARRGFPERTRDAVHLKCRAVLAPTEEAEAAPVVDQSYKLTANRSIEELLDAQVSAHERKMARHNAKKEGITVTMPSDLPYGIPFFGDPHMGDPGCNLTRLMTDLEIVKETPGMYALNMGDLSNNWCAPLARLYGAQETTADEEQEMVRWLLSHPWLAVILGNHDKWSSVAELLCREAKVPYVSHGAIFKIIAGDSVCKIDARHTHRGNSQYNPAFAQAKQNYRGSNADIIVGAHTHVSAYTMLKNGVSGNLGHCLRVGSYKEADEYADANGFAEDTIAPSCVAVVDPAEYGTESFIQVFWNLQRGADYLTMLRERRSAE